jgi:hypothetical protein
MQNAYTLTPGEFFVGEKLESNGFAVYLPTKDVGVDLLAERKGRYIKIQVKESRVYAFHPVVPWNSWSQLAPDYLTRAIKQRVDFFIFVIHAPDETGNRLRFKLHFVIISPRELETRLAAYHSRSDRAVGWYVDDRKKLWEIRGAGKRDPYDASVRDFTPYLNAWNRLR